MKSISPENQKQSLFRRKNPFHSNSRVDRGRPQAIPLSRWNKTVNTLDADRVSNMLEARKQRTLAKLKAQKSQEAVMVGRGASVQNYDIAQPLTFGVIPKEIDFPFARKIKSLAGF